MQIRPWEFKQKYNLFYSGKNDMVDVWRLVCQTNLTTFYVVLPTRHRVKYGLDQWTIRLFFGLLFRPFFGLFSKPAFCQKVIFRVGILFIYGAEEGGNGNMKMAPNYPLWIRIFYLLLSFLLRAVALAADRHHWISPSSYSWPNNIHRRSRSFIMRIMPHSS